MKLGLVRPTDRSLETYKEAVRTLIKQIGGNPDAPENRMTDEQWADAHAEYWTAIDRKGQKKPGEGLTLSELQARIDNLRLHEH